MTVTVHLVGGGEVELAIDALDLAEVAETLRYGRALLGRLCGRQDPGSSGVAILVPAGRVKLVCLS